MIAPALKRAFRWPWSLETVWLLMPSVVLTLAMAAKPIPPHDYWWHLAFGREIALGRGIPSANLFVYTLPAEAPFHDLPWLGQWLLFRLYDAFGHRGNALALSLSVLCAWWITLDAALHRARLARGVAMIASVCALLATSTLMVRTQMFAFVPFAFTLWIVFGVADGRLPSNRLWWLSPVVAFWANVHGSFVIAPILIGVVGGTHWLERKRESERLSRREIFTWVGATGAAALAGLISPVGLGNYPYLVSIFGVKNVTEWQRPDPRTIEGLLIWAALALSLLGVAWRIKRLRFYEIAVFALISYLVGSAMRSLFWWAAALPIVLAREIGALGAERREGGGIPLVNGAFATLLVALVIALQPGVLLERVRMRFLPEVRKSGEGAGLLSIDSPLSLAGRLRERAPSGRVFHDQRIGGLIEYALTEPSRPRPVAFVDQRMELLPEAVWQDYFRISSGTDWQRDFERWNVTTLIVHERAQRKLLDAIKTDAAWTQVAREDAFWMFEHRAEAAAR